MKEIPKFTLADAPDSLLMEAAVYLGYIVKRFGPFKVPSVKECQLFLAGEGLNKIKSADGGHDLSVTPQTNGSVN